MIYLGIDYGARRLGIAVSDEEGKLAFPLSVISNSANLLNEVAEICQNRKIEAIVLGDSKDFSMQENEIMREIKPFAKKLGNKTGLPVYLHQEFLTSIEAERIQGKNEMHDASSAAIILRSYLDTNNESKIK